MVFIDRSGQMLRTPPWSQRIVNLFWGVVNFFYIFLITMIPSLENRLRGGGGSGAGGGNDRDGKGPPRPPRRMGRINTLPSVPCGPSGG